jgi:hypothetical protein
MTAAPFTEFREPPREPLLTRWFAPAHPADLRSSFLWPRWIFLRALGAIFFSAFFSLAFQIHGLIGPRGILPAASYLPVVRSVYPRLAWWYVPSLLWVSASDAALSVLVWAGLAASVALLLNFWPRLSVAVATVAFMSFVSAARDFSSYQSDSMLLEAGFLSLFFAPPGWRPGLGETSPPSRASLFLLQWEWFRIYFESGVVKIASGEPQWRDLTAMDKYYENGPLPTWLGWHVQQWPHGFHAATALVTLVIELLVAWMVLLPKRSRVICFLIVTPLQIGIILTANYAFLNYLVLVLGFLLLDDDIFRRIGFPSGGRRPTASRRASWPAGVLAEIETASDSESATESSSKSFAWKSIVPAVALTWIFAATVGVFLVPTTPLLNAPARALEPFRIANAYGLFAVMTRNRYEIEFQGSTDGVHWAAYPFRYKPQDVRKAPGIYAPYQPRFEWNLWFASLGSWRENEWVINTEVRLLQNEPAVLRLFASNPFASQPPRMVRAVVSQYWFTTRQQRAATGNWWRRESRGIYAPTAVTMPDGSVRIEDDSAAEP